MKTEPRVSGGAEKGGGLALCHAGMPEVPYSSSKQLQRIGVTS